MATSTGHVRAQVLRFFRVSALAFAVQVPATGGRLEWSSLWALVAGAAEVGLRQAIPVRALPRVASVPVSAPSVGVSEAGASDVPPKTTT